MFTLTIRKIRSQSRDTISQRIRFPHEKRLNHSKANEGNSMSIGGLNTPPQANYFEPP